MREGTLVVVVSRAANLHNKRNVSKQNPFCAVRIQSLVHKTKTITRGGQNPAWDFEARFKLHEDLDSRFLKISIFDQNGSNVDLIGDCNVDLQPAFAASVEDGYDAWHDISFGGKSTGKIYLEVTFYPKYRRQSRSSTNRSSQTSFRQGLSPSASMSSLSSIGSTGGRRPLPSLPNGLGNSGSSVGSRSPSPVRVPQAAGAAARDANTSTNSLHEPPDLANCSLPDLRPTMRRAASPSRSPQMHTNLRIPHSHSARTLHENYVPRYQDLGYESDDLEIPEAPLPPAHGRPAAAHAEYAPVPPVADIDAHAYAPHAYSPHAYAPPAHAPPAHALAAYAPPAPHPHAYAPPAHAPPAHAPERILPQDLQPHISPAEPQEKKNVSHINAWYGKAMFQRFKK